MVPEGEFTFGVYIISVGRAKRGPITAKHFLEYTHVVRKSQEQEYIDNGFQNVWGIEDDLINGYDKVFNYLVDYAKDDVIAIVDDDVAQFLYREKDTVPIESPETVQAEFERIAQMLVDLRIGLAFGPPTAVPYNYTMGARPLTLSLLGQAPPLHLHLHRSPAQGPATSRLGMW